MEAHQKTNVFRTAILFVLLGMYSVCSSAELSVDQHYSTETESGNNTFKCSSSSSYKRQEMDCQLHLPPFVKVHCMQWNAAEIYIENEEKYSNLSHKFQHLVMECQSGSPFFLNQTNLNWDQVKVTHGKVIAAKSKVAGTFERHSFMVEIVIANVRKLNNTVAESYEFYKQNNGSNKNFTFTLSKTNIPNSSRSSMEQNQTIPSGINSTKNPVVKFTKNSTSCTDPSNFTEDDSLQQLINVQFLKPSESQNFLECLAHRITSEGSKNLEKLVDDCKAKGDEIQTCSTQTGSCKKGNGSWIMHGIFISGVIVCTTKDNRVEMVEYLTTLDKIKYNYTEALNLPVSKLMQVNFTDMKDERKFFHTNQNITLTYKVASYFDAEKQIYWEYRLSNGHYHSLIYGEDVFGGKGSVTLKVKKNVAQIFYFIPSTPFPIGSVINVQVSDKHKPSFYMKKTSMDAIGTVGKELALQCDFRGNPLPELQWTKDNKIISGKNIKIENSSFADQAVSILYFRNFESDNVGEYTCVGTNSEGKEHATWNVKAKGLGYEAVTGILLCLIGIVLIGIICYQIWFPPHTTAKTLIDEL